ncbi:hypothetical protein ABID29_002443 [Streptococcus rupicaprae]|uniref:Uncharacterized protein n=1 Tax=Streptococcus rupicaprae TaxID=759619 RepID=A0ABV2FL22_9STRE
MVEKELREYGLIEKAQQSSSEKGRLANKIYLGELEQDMYPVQDSDGDGVQNRRSQSQKQTGLVSELDTNETEVTETDIIDTKGSDCLLEDEEEKDSLAK